MITLALKRRLMRVLVTLAVFAGLFPPCSSSLLAQTSVAQVDSEAPLGGEVAPNIIFILVDDMAAIEFDLGFGQSLPEWESAFDRELRQKGTWFGNLFNSTPLCCPSRVNYLTGKFGHNNLVWGNNYDLTAPPGSGGWRRFYELGWEDRSIGSWMQDVGYQTVLIGKFLNGYPNKPRKFVDENYIPGGWDEWFGTFTNDVPFSYYDFRLNVNGTITEFGKVDPAYLTDVERDFALDYIARAAVEGEPFFMYLAPFAPHGPTEPADRHRETHDLDIAPPPSYNEEDLSDKPQHLQDDAEPFVQYLGGGFQRKLDMTLALDELIDALFDQLEALELLDSTYVFFTSDNGLMNGEHQLGGKSAPYEESVRTPLIVRGPGVEEGVEMPHLLLNVDMAPTFIDLAGGEVLAEIDGESIVPVLEGTVTGLDWRDSVYFELESPVEPTGSLTAEELGRLSATQLESWDREPSDLPEANQPVRIPRYDCVRTFGYVYCEYETGDVELYDLVADPFQLESLHDSASDELLAALKGPLELFKPCVGSECHSAFRSGAPNARPDIVLEYSCVSLDCSFDASGSFDRDGTVVSIAWDLGDGALSTSPSVDHSYALGADYQVELVVTDNEGETHVQLIELELAELFCSDDLLLANASIESRVLYESTGEITAEGVTVTPQGDLILRAPDGVWLADGVEVLTGGKLSVEVAAPSSCESAQRLR